MVQGIALNEDNSHYFYPRPDARVEAWVDQYAQTQVKELMLCSNAMRTSYASKVWDPIWRDYDPDGDDDQPLFKSLPPKERKITRLFVHKAWQFYKDGVDVYKVWIKRCRDKNISPWISMRMNDVHCVNDEQNGMHSEFWRNNPQLRRVSYRPPEWVGKAFDYGIEEVRRYSMSLIEELTERYDFDGLELDWMRFGFHFRPGYESEGASILTGFTASVRRLLDDAEQKRGHKIKLGARIPSRPLTAVGLGMDGVVWARKKLVDMLVVTPFWETSETDMPVELWKQLLDGTNVMLAAGLELLIRPYPQSALRQTNSLETVRGTAISFLDRGADRIYLFNYFDSGTAIKDLHNYPRLLREVGSIDTIIGKPRRYVVTYADTWAPGEPRAAALPVLSRKDEWKEFRVHIGPKPDSGKITVVLGLLEDVVLKEKTAEVRINGELCAFIGPLDSLKPKPDFLVYGFDVPLSAVKSGYNLIETVFRKKVTLGWVELKIIP